MADLDDEGLAIGDTDDLPVGTVKKADIIDFANQFDTQPFHMDKEAAADLIFSELVGAAVQTGVSTWVPWPRSPTISPSAKAS